MHPHFLIHVAPHDTGTTYLQACFTESHEALGRIGICYPTQWQRKQHGAHIDLPGRIAKGDAGLVEEFAELRRGDHRLILLFAEGLSELSPGQVKRFQELIGDADVDVVFYVRRFSELLPAAWREEIKQGSRMTFPAYIHQHLSQPIASTVLNLDQKISRYVSVFGAEHVKLVSYNNVLDQGTDMFLHFAREFLGCELEPVLQSSTRDTTLNLIDAEMIRALNGLHHLQGGEPGPLLHLGYTGAGRSKQPEHIELLRSAMAQDVAALRLGDQIAALNGSQLRILRNFAKLVVNPLPDGTCYISRDVTVDYVDANYMTRPGSFDVLWELYRYVLAYGRQQVMP